MRSPASAGGGHGFSFYEHIPGLNLLPYHIAGALLVFGILFVTTWIASGQLKRVMASAEGGLVPEQKLTFRNFFEILAENLYKLTESVIGAKEAPHYFPVMGCLFIFIFTSNLLGMIPGFLPPTDNMNTTLALGLFVFFYYNYIGIKTHGAGYIKHFMGPVWWLAPLLFLIEIVSHLARPFTLALRLRGNISGDHLVLGIFSDLAPYGIPIIFMAFGLFVAFLQSFIFVLLTMVYISLSTAHDH